MTRKKQEQTQNQEQNIDPAAAEAQLEAYMRDQATKRAEFFGIGDLAKALHRKPLTIRQWEREGVIPPSGHESPGVNHHGRRRLYSRAQVEGIVAIAEEEGLLLGDRREIASTDFTPRVKKLFEKLLEESDRDAPAADLPGRRRRGRDRQRAELAGFGRVSDSDPGRRRGDLRAGGVDRLVEPVGFDSAGLIVQRSGCAFRIGRGTCGGFVASPTPFWFGGNGYAVDLCAEHRPGFEHAMEFSLGFVCRPEPRTEPGLAEAHRGPRRRGVRIIQRRVTRARAER